MNLQEKKERLQEILRSYGKVAIAYSSGVDSTFLLKVAHDTLGDNAIAITVKSLLVSAAEMDEAEAFCKRENIRHQFIIHDEMSVPGFAENPPNRCYICKRQIFSSIQATVRDEFVVCEGSNKDDEGDYRPGMKAIAELSVKSPLREAGLTKAEIRELSRELSLPTASKPSFACLASRIPYGQIITRQKLQLVETAEKFLQDLGFVQYRVRCREASPATSLTASIELLPEQFNLFKTNQELIIQTLKNLGFAEVRLDEKGYRTGSLNEALGIKHPVP
ncbi:MULTISPECIES: ATP-dependent sacrificial sulfur transferase LarE [unclassified Fibrobacter]|uniref:ATP-dependent sacrificial sulfur transferase LarE n=1 Tax=unclassified Fibrobacter TaxID=2634177 RepID=UPI0009207085|nr:MULTISPECIES: ATP-dependent sacrificial sulfur transferase LarE [unclassified Fibrobacter]OWV04907.1 TIGR00268 family protein [Fibrobacter sp. UWH3]SHK38612.1 uncharacterized protein SAMN05720765_102108 [Fibrobacter sp. UWH6]